MSDEDKALVRWLREEADFAYEIAQRDALTDAANRIEALEEALAQQVEACFCLDCEMCFRHEQLLKGQSK